jgi:hypothetical protein
MRGKRTLAVFPHRVESVISAGAILISDGPTELTKVCAVGVGYPMLLISWPAAGGVGKKVPCAKSELL